MKLKNHQKSRLIVPLVLLSWVLLVAENPCTCDKTSAGYTEHDVNFNDGMDEIFSDREDIKKAITEYLDIVPSSHRSRSHASQLLVNLGEQPNATIIHHNRFARSYPNFLKMIISLLFMVDREQPRISCKSACEPCRDLSKHCARCPLVDECRSCPPCPPSKSCPTQCPPKPEDCPCKDPALKPVEPSKGAMTRTVSNQRCKCKCKPSIRTTTANPIPCPICPFCPDKTTTTTKSPNRSTTRRPKATTKRPATSRKPTSKAPRSTRTPKTTAQPSKTSTTERPLDSYTTTMRELFVHEEHTKQEGHNHYEETSSVHVETSSEIYDNFTDSSSGTNGEYLFEKNVKLLIPNNTLRHDVLEMIENIPDTTGGDETRLANRILSLFGEQQPEPKLLEGTSRLIAVKGARSNVKSVLGYMFNRIVRDECDCPECKLPKVCKCDKKPAKATNCPSKSKCAPCPLYLNDKAPCPVPKNCPYPACPKCPVEENLDTDEGTNKNYDDADPMDPIRDGELNETVTCKGFICDFQKQCGQANLNPLTPKNSQSGYMVGGENQKYGEWPQFVRLSIKISTGQQGICGAVLITNRHLLTAGHCVQMPTGKTNKNGSANYEKLEASAITAYLGDHLRHKKDKFEEERKIKSICYSSKFNDPKGEGSRYDFAILEMDNNVTFNDHIQPSCLPYKPFPLNSKTKCFVVGLGIIKWSPIGAHQFADTVQKMPLKRASCDNWGIRHNDRSRHCFTKIAAKGDTCAGDSGGPVICLNPDKRWTTMGLVSYGSESCDGTDSVGWVAVYTRVQTLLKTMNADYSMLMDENRKKLELETYSLSLLKEMSQKCCSHTASIRTILSEFDDRLAKLERNIQPVYKETGNLQSKQADLVKTLEKLDYVIQFYSVTDEVEETIRTGPANQLELYMQCLKKLKSSIQYFSQNNPDSPEYMNVSSLFKYGCEAVEKEFRLTLQRYSSPMAPIGLLDIINDDAAEQQLDSTNSGNTTTTSQSGSYRRQQPDMPQDKIEDLRVMCEWLCYNCNEDLINIYADLRSDYISKSLKSLQDYQKSRSVTFNMMASTSGSGPAGSSRSSVDSPDLALNKKRLGVSGSNSREPSTRRTPKSIQLAFKRKLHNVIPGDVHKLSSSSMDDISISEREIVSYLTCITAFHKLAVNELNLMSNILPADLKIPIYNRMIQESLKLIANEANSLTVRVKKSISRHDFKSALNLFPILRHQTLRRHNFDLLFDGCQSEVLAKFQGLTITFQATISKSLEEFAGFVHTDNDMKVPGDGTVHELTNNVMIFIEQLHEYLDIMSSVIPVKDMQAMENTSDKNRLGFAQYITRLLGSLGETIQRKAENYTNLHLVFLFKLNNFHYILKRLKESGLLEIVHSYNSKVREIYEDLIMDSKNEYIKSLYPVLSYLRDLHETRTKTIKDRFTGFNKEFQELYRLNRTYAVPDLDLRTQIRDACKREFLSTYQQFYSYYINQDFSKNKEKYVKYTPELLASMIDQFFESN